MNGTSNALRLGFAGTPAFAARIFQALLDAGRKPVVVYTQPDRPTGRGQKTRPSPVKQLALEQGIPLEQPHSLRGDEPAAVLRTHDLDLLVVAAYGLILPRSILEVPRHGCINVHASLLPRWRGAAPIERAIMAGDEQTGVCIMQMDAGLDTGPVYECRSCPIHPNTDGPTLEDTLAGLGGSTLIDCLDRLPGMRPVAQPEVGVTYAPKVTRDDAAIRWSRPVLETERQVRALSGRMPAFGYCDGIQLRVLKAEALITTEPHHAPGVILGADRAGILVSCGGGILRITRLQLSRGKSRPMTAAEALNGYSDFLSQGCVLHDGHQ